MCVPNVPVSKAQQIVKMEDVFGNQKIFAQYAKLIIFLMTTDCVLLAPPLHVKHVHLIKMTHAPHVLMDGVLIQKNIAYVQ